MPNRYLHNESFFDTIDSAEKAYVLGLFYADGNNFAGTRYRVSITLKKDDSYLLEEVNRLLGSHTSSEDILMVMAAFTRRKVVMTYM
jgi:hypothetical protein